MPKVRGSNPAFPPPKYTGENRYTYIVNAELKGKKRDVNVRREKWKDNAFHVAARDSKGHFIATKKWSMKSQKSATIKAFEYKYKGHPYTFKITSKKNYDMRSKKNQSIIFNKIKAKYKRKGGPSGDKIIDSSFRYRYKYDSITGAFS